MNYKLAISFILLFILNINNIFAGVGVEMKRLFKSFGADVNLNEGGAYKLQSGGYYTGGSIYTRFPSRNYQFASMQAPSINAGCGGIDIFAGSFSHINADQLVGAMRTVMSNAKGYAFNLSLQTFVPQVYNTMQKMNDIARDINNLNINSCQMSAQLLGGVWPKSDEASRNLCHAMGTSGNKFTDWAKARHECGATSKRKEINNDTGIKGFEDQLGDEFNLAWIALNKGNIKLIDGQTKFMSGTKPVNENELAEFFMSLSGTIIGKVDGDGENAKITLERKPSLARDSELLHMLLFGNSKNNTAEIYECKEKEKCLNVTKQKLVLDKDGLINQIEAQLFSIAKKAKSGSDEQLTQAEKNLIENTEIPILRIISLETVNNLGHVINTSEYTEYIAYDYLLTYLKKILDMISVNTDKLASIQMSDHHIQEFKKDINDLRSMILKEQANNKSTVNIKTNIQRKAKFIEQKVKYEFRKYQNLK